MESHVSFAAFVICPLTTSRLLFDYKDTIAGFKNSFPSVLWKHFSIIPGKEAALKQNFCAAGGGGGGCSKPQSLANALKIAIT